MSGAADAIASAAASQWPRPGAIAGGMIPATLGKSCVGTLGWWCQIKITAKQAE